MPQSDQERQAEIRAKLDKLREEHDQLLASLAEEDSGSGDLPEPLGEPDAENIETGDAAGSELPEPDPIVESNGVRIYEPPTGVASAQAPPETPEVASGTATKSHHPIPEPSRSDASLGSDVDVDWTPEATKGLDLSDGEFLATPEEAEPGPSLGIDGVASGLEQYVVTIAGVLRQMEDILLEATRVQEDTRSRFDRIR